MLNAIERRQFIATRMHAQDVSQQPGIFPYRATHCQETGNTSRRRKKVVELYTDDTYEYRAIATNIKHLNNSEIVHEYNQRGEHQRTALKS